MSAKTERLVRDLAQLFAKYSLSDWQPVLDELRQSGQSHSKLAAAIESHARLAERVKPKPKRAKKAKPIRRSVHRDPEEGVFQTLQASLFQREILPRAQDLKAAALLIGVKEQLPNDRREATRVILDYLRNQSPERQKRSLEILRADLQRRQPDLSSEFERWVAVIMRPRESS